MELRVWKTTWLPLFIGAVFFSLLIAMLVGVAAILVGLVRVRDKMNRQTKAFETKMDTVQAQLLELYRTTRVPDLRGLKATRIGDWVIKVKDYPIPRVYVPNRYWDARALPPAGWTPASEQLPYPYPSQFSYEGKPFHPWQFLQNVVALCNYSHGTGSWAEVQPRIQQMLSDLETHVRRRGPAAYYCYPFDHEVYDRKLSKGWVSAFGNAAILCGMVRLYEETKEPRYREAARTYFAAFTQISRQSDQTEPWFTYVDSCQYLWFEEAPCTGPNQMHIFNGHVFSLMALDYYLTIAPEDRDAVHLLLRAGITTMHRYLNELRRPGGVSRYSLYAPYLFSPQNGDYGPVRALDCIEWLGQMSDDAYFATMLETFRMDNAVAE